MADRVPPFRQAARQREGVETTVKIPTASCVAAPLPGAPGADSAEIFAQTALHPILQAVDTIRGYRKAMDGTQLDLVASFVDLSKQVQEVSDGDLGRAEAMLISQAHSLDAIYGNLARRAAVQEFLPQIDCLLRLALKAQNQCRATLEVLATIKHPPSVSFVQQANIAAGPQQVNNGIPPGETSQSQKTENRPNELLEVQLGQRMDIGTSAAAGCADRHLAPVGEVDRTKNARGEG